MGHCNIHGTYWTEYCPSCTWSGVQQLNVTGSLTPSYDLQILTELQKIGALLERFTKHQETEADRRALAAHWNA